MRFMTFKWQCGAGSTARKPHDVIEHVSDVIIQQPVLGLMRPASLLIVADHSFVMLRSGSLVVDKSIS